jgi:hypothetical protein
MQRELAQEHGLDTRKWHNLNTCLFSHLNGIEINQELADGLFDYQFCNPHGTQTDLIASGLQFVAPSFVEFFWGKKASTKKYGCQSGFSQVISIEHGIDFRVFVQEVVRNPYLPGQQTQFALFSRFVRHQFHKRQIVL